jgi:hypothetical protein
VFYNHLTEQGKGPGWQGGYQIRMSWSKESDIMTLRSGEEFEGPAAVTFDHLTG